MDRLAQSSQNQWRSYTQAHMGPGPGEFLSALVNHVRSTYLNRNSTVVDGIVVHANANF